MCTSTYILFVPTKLCTKVKLVPAVHVARADMSRGSAAVYDDVTKIRISDEPVLSLVASQRNLQAILLFIARHLCSLCAICSEELGAQG